MQASRRLARGMRLAGGGLLARLEQHAAAGRTAIVDADGTATSYADLLRGAHAVGHRIRSERAFARGERVAFLAPPGVDFVRTLIGVWQAGGVAVPLCVTHPEAELRYALTEADACMVAAASDTLAARAQPIAESEGRAFFRVEEARPSGDGGDGGGGGGDGGGGGGGGEGGGSRQAVWQTYFILSVHGLSFHLPGCQLNCRQSSLRRQSLGWPVAQLVYDSGVLDGLHTHVPSDAASVPQVHTVLPLAAVVSSAFCAADRTLANCRPAA